MRRQNIKLGYALAFLLLLFGTSSAARFTEKGINYWSAPDHTRIVIALSKKSKVYQKFYLNPPRIAVQFEAKIKGWTPSVIRVNDDLIEKIVRRKKTVLIYLKKRLSYRVFTLRPYKIYPFRIVIDVLKPKTWLEKQRKLRIERAKRYKEEKKYIIVLDPGHGGSDPGAIKNGLFEKWIVLDIAKRVARYLKKDPNFAVFLTRSGDYYVPLRKRVELAHDYNADVFISIHVNSAPDKRLSGIMAFVLSERGARDSLARMLENQENAEQIAKDIQLVSSRKVNQVVLDVAHDFSVAEGRKLGQYILAYTSSICGFKNRGIRKAAFVVLKNPGIPSLLLEVGFLSNPRDARLLKSSLFREKVAYSIYWGIKKYFENKKRILAEAKRIHFVRKGDTLWKISRLYGVSVKEIVESNHLKSYVLKPGMKLAIP